MAEIRRAEQYDRLREAMEANAAITVVRGECPDCFGDMGKHLADIGHVLFRHPGLKRRCGDKSPQRIGVFTRLLHQVTVDAIAEVVTFAARLGHHDCAVWYWRPRRTDRAKRCILRRKAAQKIRAPDTCAPGWRSCRRRWASRAGTKSCRRSCGQWRRTRATAST